MMLGFGQKTRGEISNDEEEERGKEEAIKCLASYICVSFSQSVIKHIL
jgi:hypothetical protein